MSCKRCSVCNLNLPKAMMTCPVCDDPLWLDIKGTEDELWHWKATNLIQMRDQEKEEDTQPYFMLLQVHEDDKGFFLDRHDAYRARQNRVLELDDVVELPSEEGEGTGVLWEVQYVDRDHGRYYIRQVLFPGEKVAVTISRPVGEPLTQDLVMYDPAIWEGDGD